MPWDRQMGTRWASWATSWPLSRATFPAGTAVLRSSWSKPCRASFTNSAFISWVGERRVSGRDPGSGQGAPQREARPSAPHSRPPAGTLACVRLSGKTGACQRPCPQPRSPFPCTTVWAHLVSTPSPLSAISCYSCWRGGPVGLQLMLEEVCLLVPALSQLAHEATELKWLYGCCTITPPLG